MKSQGITKPVTVYPVRNRNVCTVFHENIDELTDPKRETTNFSLVVVLSHQERSGTRFCAIQ